jgi:drug/metabolite transporter (DMT)-like permease
MSLTAIILIVISAAMHAAWNYVGKSRRPSIAFFCAATAMGTVCLLPLLAYHHEAVRAVPADVWALLLMTSVAQSIYFCGLAVAYRTGDMSIAYPMARSSPIIVVTIVTFVLGRGDELSAACIAGAALVVVGCFMLPMRRFTDFHPGNYLNLCALAALFAAFGTSGYSILDDEALRRLRELPGSAFTTTTAPMIYVILQGGITSLYLATVIAASRTERYEMRAILRAGKRRAALTGAVIYITYGLVLASMAFAQNVSYVVAFRQLSIPIGAALGVVLLKEPCPPPKIAGLVVLVAGLVLVAVG